MPGIFTWIHEKVGLYFFVMINGGLAQLGEHLLCKQGVVGSIPSSSTILSREYKRKRRHGRVFRFGLFEITVFSFFNNLEEVKFF